MADPAFAVQRIVALVGETESFDPPSSDRTAELGVKHAVAGNLSRFDRGQVSITLDTEWTEHLAARDRRIVAMPCAPVSARYGYAMRTRRRLNRA